MGIVDFAFHSCNFINIGERNVACRKILVNNSLVRKKMDFGKMKN
jgi:hypothetical protein